MSVGAIAWALIPRGLRPVDKNILMIFADAVDSYSGELSAPLSAIAAAAEVSVRTAHDSISRLCDLGILSKRAEFSANLQKQNTYSIGPSFKPKETLFPLGSFCRPAVRVELPARPESKPVETFASLGSFCRVEEGFNENTEEQEQVEVVTLNGNSNLSNARRKKRAYLDENPPKLEEWMGYLKSDPKIDWFPVAEAEDSFDWYVAHGWRQKDGTRLVDWKAVLRRSARSWKKRSPREYAEIIRIRETAARASQPFVSEIAQIRARQRSAAAGPA